MRGPAQLQYSFRVDPSARGGWTVWFPDLPGCSGWAETLEDVGLEAKTILGLWLESEHERGHPVPTPVDYASEEKWPQGNRVEIHGLGPVIGVADVAKLLGVSVRRVQALAKDRGVGQRFGNYLVFTEADINRLQPHAPGRPRGSGAGRLSTAAD
jgi:predicted RNase H-like HicB family nuclease